LAPLSDEVFVLDLFGRVDLHHVREDWKPTVFVNLGSVPVTDGNLDGLGEQVICVEPVVCVGDCRCIKEHSQLPATLGVQVRLRRVLIQDVILVDTSACLGLVVALGDAQIKYSTIQNWYPGDKDGKGGIYNFVTKRGLCAGKNSKISWTQVETGSSITWKYPSCILKGDNSVGEFYSVAITNNKQQADTGTKMIHIGKNTKSTIVSKGISAGRSQNAYRGLVKMMKSADGARNFSQCDSMLMGNECGAHTFPYIEVKNPTATVEHEASTSKIGEDQIFYCNQRGISTEDAVSMIVHG
jgi:hypothetical protein